MKKDFWNNWDAKTIVTIVIVIGTALFNFGYSKSEADNTNKKLSEHLIIADGKISEYNNSKTDIEVIKNKLDNIQKTLEEIKQDLKRK